MKRIAYQKQYMDLEGRAVRAADEDAAGEIVWEIKPDESQERGTLGRAGKPKLHSADTYDVLRQAVRGLAAVPSIHKFDDDRRATGLYIAIDAAREGNSHAAALAPDKAWGNDVLLGDGLYAWLMDLLARKLPLNEEATKRQDTAPSYAWYLWQSNAWRLVNALRDPSDKEYVSNLSALASE